MSKQFEGDNLCRARKYDRIGVIQFEFDLDNVDNKSNIYKERELMINVATEFNADRISFTSVKLSDLVNRGAEYVVRQIDKIVANFKKYHIYRIVLPSISSILGPYLSGTYHNNVRFSVREPKIIVAVNNPGTSEVENNSNVWRFINASDDPLGEINKNFYTQKLGATGNILILYDATANGVDDEISLNLLNILQTFVTPQNRISRFGLIPNNAGSFTNWNLGAIAVASLPVGSILVFYSNQTVPGNVFLADSGSSALFTNNNVVTYVSANFDLLNVAPPVKFENGYVATNFTASLPNYWSKKFQFSDSLEDAATYVGLWNPRYFGTTIIEIIAWLATKGEFAGISGDLKFPENGTAGGNKYGQSRLCREIISIYRSAGSLIDTTLLIGLNSLYYNFTPGTFQILYSA